MTLEETQKLMRDYLAWHYSHSAKAKMVDHYKFAEALKFLHHFIDLFHENMLIPDIPIDKMYDIIHGDKCELLKNYTSHLNEKLNLNLSEYKMKELSNLFIWNQKEFYDDKKNNQRLL